MKKLRDVGVPEVQAEALVVLFEERLASKLDLHEQIGTLQRDMKEMETSLRHDI